MASVVPMPGSAGIDVGRPGQQLLPGYVVKLLKTLKIPFGTDRSMGGVDVDPTVNLVTHIFDCIGALRDVNKVYRAKGSLVSRSVGTRVLFGFTAELGNILLDSITFDPPHDLLDSAVYYSQIANAILNVFPEISAQVTPSTGKVLLHHTALKTSSIMAIESLKMVLKAFPAGAWTADKSGALPLHWITHNANCTPEMINYLINANPKAPWVADADGYLPLHWAVNQDTPNIDVVAALITANPSAASKACNKGSLPIHWCINRERPHLGVMRALVQVHPDGLRTFDKTGWLPLHQCVNRSEISIEAVQALIELYPQALQCPNSNGQLPLHRALDQANPHIEAVHIMLQAFPGAAKVADDEGYLPLHLALDCARPNPQIAAMLLEHYPEAAFHKSKDGLLPMHCIISAMHPVVEIIQLLLQIFPDSSESMAVDLIPVEETADPETWQGEWIEKRWTPLSRAIDRGLDAIVMLFRDALGSGKGNTQQQQLPPRGSSAPSNRNFMPQSKPPIHNISHITNNPDAMNAVTNHMSQMNIVNTVPELQQQAAGGVGPGPSTSSVEGSHHRNIANSNPLVLGGNLDSEDEPNLKVPREALLQDSDNEYNIRVANNSSSRMQLNRPINNSTGNLLANSANPPPIKDRAPGGSRNPTLNPMMSNTLPANLADMKAKERERRSSARDGDRERERSSRRSSSRRGERRSSSRHRGDDRGDGDRDRERGESRHRYEDEEDYYEEDDRHRSRHRSSSRRRESSRERSHDRHRDREREHRDRRESRDHHREHRERERIYENTEYDDEQQQLPPNNLPISNAAQDSNHLFQQPLANNAAVVNKVRPSSSNAPRSSLLEAASSRPNTILQQPPGGYNRRGLSAGSARPNEEFSNNPNIIRTNQNNSQDLSDPMMNNNTTAYLDPNTPANLDEIV